jgi:ribonuclease-3
VVVVMETSYGSGIGRTKKEAEQKAAEMACQALDQLDAAVPGESAG